MLASDVHVGFSAEPYVRVVVVEPAARVAAAGLHM